MIFNGMILVIVFYGLFSFLGQIFRCIPLQSQYDLDVVPTACLHRDAFNYSCAAINILLDVAIFSVPIPLIRKLQMPKRQKRALYLVFSFGAL